MKQKLRDFVKYNKMLYNVYNKMGSIFVRFIGLFMHINNKKILFISFGGRKYDDSPRAIYEEMIQRKEFEDYIFVWAFVEPEKDLPGNPIIIKTDSLSYFYHALTSRFWITNTSAERNLRFKKKGNICINTWHGTPLKKIYGEENAKQKLNNKKRTIRKDKVKKFDLVCAQSSYDREIFSRIFNMDISDIIISDLPRNDTLLNYSGEDIRTFKERLGIERDKKIILYMPTYREYLRDSGNACYMAPPMNLEKWESILGEQYVLLIRAHYLVSREMDIRESDFVKDVSKYPQLSELYVISDMLISDYSSAFIDFSILERPEFCFAYDYKEYCAERGFYIDLEKELPCTLDSDEDRLLKNITDMDYSEMCHKTYEFKRKYAPVAGNATSQVIDEMVSRYL